MADKVYVNYWMQFTIEKQRETNFKGLLEDINGLLTVRENKCEHLGTGFLAWVMQFDGIDAPANNVSNRNSSAGFCDHPAGRIDNLAAVNFIL